MKRGWRSVLHRARWVVVAAIMASSSLAAASASAVEEGTEAASPIERLGGCLAGGGAGDIVLLMDESESVRETDPEDDRVTAATYFVNQLTSYAVDNSADVSVQVATFAADYTPALDWTPLNEDTLDDVHAAVEEVGGRDSGWETDYWTALFGAQQELAAASAGREGPSCQAVVWFSDGELWFNPTPNAELRPNDRKGFAPDLVIEGQAAADEAHDAAASDLCREGGLADQLRAAGVITFGIGLDGGTLAPGGFDLMRSIVTGHASESSAPCGAVLDPVPGTFFVTSDIDSMLFAFDQLSTPGEPPLEQERGICQVVVCADEGHRIVLDQSAPSVRILATSSIDGASVSLQSPSGTVVEIPIGAGTVDIDGAAATYEWESERTVSIGLDQAQSKSWDGLWQLAFTDPAGTSATEKSRSSIRVAGAFVPAWSNSADVALYAGDTVDNLQIGLARRDGEPVDSSVITGGLKYSAVFRDSDGGPVTIIETTSPEELEESSTLDLSGAALGAATVTLRSQITTAATEFEGELVPGTTLQAETVTIPVTVLPPLEYPSVATSVDFGSVESDSISLIATLPVDGEGCVRIADSSPTVVAAPAGIGEVKITAGDSDECHPAAAGGVELTLTTERGGNGTMTGTFVATLEPDGAGEPLETTVSFTASLMRPINALNFWATLITALILGPGLPLALLYGFKWLGSTIPTHVLYGFVTPVEVVGSKVLRDGAPFAVRDTDAVNQVSLPPRSRKITVGGVGLRAAIGGSPFGRGHVVVDAPGRSSAAGAAPFVDRSGVRAVLPLDIHNNWVILRTPGDPAGRASLLVLLPGVDANTREQFSRRVTDGVPARLRALVDAEQASGVATAEAPVPTPGDAIWGSSPEAGRPISQTDRPGTSSGAVPRSSSNDPWASPGSDGQPGGGPQPPNPFA